MAELRFEGATRIYPGSDEAALDSLDLKVDDRELIVLVGPSGSGKTTALRMLAGLEEPAAADLLLPLGRGPQRGQHDRGAVQRPQRVIVVELEALDEAAVEQRGARRAGARAPADDGAIARAFELAHDAGRGARPGQLRAHDGTGDAVEREHAGALARGGRRLVE